MTLLNYTWPTPVPPPVTTGTTVQSYMDPFGDYWVAKNGVNQGQWNLARNVLHARAYRNAAWTTPTALAPTTLDTVTRDPFGLFATGPPNLIVPMSGMYAIYYQSGMVATAANQLMQVSLQQGGSVNQALATVNVYSGGAGNPMANVYSVSYLAAGDAIQFQFRGAAALVGLIGANSTFASFDYLGSG
jgi:hypothetical protein